MLVTGIVVIAVIVVVVAILVVVVAVAVGVVTSVGVFNSPDGLLSQVNGFSCIGGRIFDRILRIKGEFPIFDAVCYGLNDSTEGVGDS